MTHRRNRSRSFLIATLLFFGAASGTEFRGQIVVDKTVATVSDGFRTELITYSDILWQLALQPNTPIDPPAADDVQQALRVLIDQRVFALEAERLPRNAPTDAEIREKIAQTVTFFASPAAFEARLKRVGFSSVSDEAFEQLISRRMAIDRYVDFRFRSFVVVSADEITRYYREVYVPEFRRRSPGLLVPTLEERTDEIREILMESKVADRIDEFLEDTKRRVQIEILLEP
jgi:hypothetical protein